ncbi:MAG TPA: hypothetical protein DCS93_08465 [Microscillaceae bacterium]|nr:hypothetical protein [Microscillaceae bacterium]
MKRLIITFWFGWVLLGCQSVPEDKANVQTVEEVIEQLNKTPSPDVVSFYPTEGNALFDDKKIALKILKPRRCVYQFDLDIFPWEALQQAFITSKTLTITISATFKDGDHMYDRQFQFLPVKPNSMHYHIKVNMCNFGYIHGTEKATFKIQGHLQSGKEVFQTLIHTPMPRELVI